MTNKELRKLSRSDLLEMLIDQSTEMETLREKLSAAETALHKKELTIDKAGSLAEASLQMNGVFEAAQAACEQYTENIRLLSERSQLVCRQMEKEAREQADLLLEETRRRCAQMEAEAGLNADLFEDQF